MICDAHVHIGYFSRKGEDEPRYYSPRRILGVLNRCGVDEFVVSSTCAQIESIRIRDIVAETRELKRLAGKRAHPFFWLSGHLYDEDRSLSWIGGGLFEGVKLHEAETPWMRERREELDAILRLAERNDLPVQMHCPWDGCFPADLAELAAAHPRVRFDFAHCNPMDEMADVVARCSNVWTDIACLPFDRFEELGRYDWHGRLLFGTDLPTWQAKETAPLTKRYREILSAWRKTSRAGEAQRADPFRAYLGK